MFGKLGYRRDLPAVRRGYEYLRREQEEDGSWFGRWGVNYIYGVGAVLPALAALDEDMSQPYVRRSVDWLLSYQNADGGWGESCGSYVDPALHGVGPSTASQTAWALLALLAAGEADAAATQRGVDYLVSRQNADGSWDEPYFTGTGFPGYGVGERLRDLPKPGELGYQGLDMPAGFMINYHLYRNYWPLMALGRYARLTGPGSDVGPH
jgi:squalene-hopene/tetraprenyl-beta-curcumene cyclase